MRATQACSPSFPMPARAVPRSTSARDGRIRLVEAPAQSFDLWCWTRTRATWCPPTCSRARRSCSMSSASARGACYSMSPTVPGSGARGGCRGHSLGPGRWERLDTLDTAEQRLPSARWKGRSRWIVIGRSNRDLNHWSRGGVAAASGQGTSVWTDDYVNIVGALRW